MPPRWWRVLPGLWAGLLIAVAALAAPSAFAVLPRGQAGHLVARIFAQEAWASLVLGGVLLAALSISALRSAKRSFALERGLLYASLAATLLGYFAVQPWLSAARQESAIFSFAQLHLFSTVMYALKTLAVLGLAWRASRL